MRYRIIINAPEHDWNSVLWKLGLTTDADIPEVLVRIEKLDEERKLLVDSLRLAMSGDPDLINGKVWKLPDWKQYNDEFYDGE